MPPTSEATFTFIEMIVGGAEVPFPYTVFVFTFMSRFPWIWVSRHFCDHEYVFIYVHNSKYDGYHYPMLYMLEV